MQAHKNVEKSIQMLRDIYPEWKIPCIEDQVCSACDEEYQCLENSLLTCYCCGVMCHIFCQMDVKYNYSATYFTYWLCDSCRFLVQSESHAKPSCFLCPADGGVLRHYTKESPLGFVDWAHIGCMNHLKEVFRDSKLKGTQPLSLDGCCRFCMNRDGLRLECAAKGCNKSFHHGCARQNGIVLCTADMESLSMLIPSSETGHGIFCIEHLYETMKHITHDDEKTIAKVYHLLKKMDRICYKQRFTHLQEPKND